MQLKSLRLYISFFKMNNKGENIMVIKRKRLSAEERKQIYDMFDGHCAYCGCEITIKNMQVDHIEPLRNGGTDTLDNMFPACRSCNHYKCTMTIEKFRKQVERMPYVLMRDSVTYKNAVRFELVIPNPHNVLFYFEKKQNGLINQKSTDIIAPTKINSVLSSVNYEN